MTLDFAHLNKENYNKGEKYEPKCNSPFPWGAKAQQNVLCIPLLHIKWSIINKLDPKVGYS
jgi:hypothetical protein